MIGDGAFADSREGTYGGGRGDLQSLLPGSAEGEVKRRADVVGIASNTAAGQPWPRSWRLAQRDRPSGSRSLANRARPDGPGLYTPYGSRSQRREDVRFVVAPSFQDQKLQVNPARFKAEFASDCHGLALAPPHPRRRTTACGAGA